MTKYILNETPIKTTNNFNINNIKVDLKDIDNYEFEEYIINNVNNIYLSTNIKDDFNSTIGLTHKKYKELNINVKQNTNLDDILEIKYEFNNKPNLIDEINIYIEENSNLKVYIDYKSILDNIENFHNLKLNISMKENSNLNLTMVNELNTISTNIVNILSNVSNSSNCIINFIDLNANKRIYKVDGTTYKEATTILNNVYIGKDHDLIDMNYCLKNMDKYSNNFINVEGVLDNNAIKHFKGTIDFKSGSTKSVGKENENITVLSENVISRSMPMLLCGEEDVVGAHSVSEGNIDMDKLFYLESRGLNENEAKRIIIESNIKRILTNTPSEIYDNILGKIKNYI